MTGTPGILLLIGKDNKKVPTRITSAKLNAICWAGFNLYRILRLILLKLMFFKDNLGFHIGNLCQGIVYRTVFARKFHGFDDLI